MGKARIIIQILILANNLALRWSLASSVLSPFIRFWNNLTALQTAAVISALVLTIGAVIEYWYKLKLLAFLVLKWILRKSTSFDRCVFRRLLLHSIGPILVVLGIAGEVVFEGRTFLVEDRQEEQARTIVGSLKKQAEQADEKAKKAIADSSTALSQANDALGKAGKAQESLGKAEDEANKAETAASSALGTARQARQEAHSFEKEIASAKEAAAKAEAKLADRTLSDEQVRSIAAKLSVFVGQAYTVTAYWDSKESLGIANRIHSGLLLAKWTYSDEGSKGMMLGGEIGVLVWTHPDARENTKKAALSLVDALNAAGIEATPKLQNPKNPKSDMINISVGAKR
jgi:hypothetical protein